MGSKLNMTYYSKHWPEMFSLAIFLIILFFKYLYWSKIKQVLNVKNVSWHQSAYRVSKIFLRH